MYNIHICLYILIIVGRPLKMCLNENYSKVNVGTHFSDTFCIQNGLRKGDTSVPLLLNFALEYAVS
jgi:hypothetical protein